MYHPKEYCINQHPPKLTMDPKNDGFLSSVHLLWNHGEKILRKKISGASCRCFVKPTIPSFGVSLPIFFSEITNHLDVPGRKLGSMVIGSVVISPTYKWGMNSLGL